LRVEVLPLSKLVVREIEKNLPVSGFKKAMLGKIKKIFVPDCAARKAQDVEC